MNAFACMLFVSILTSHAYGASDAGTRAGSEPWQRLSPTNPGGILSYVAWLDAASQWALVYETVVDDQYSAAVHVTNDFQRFEAGPRLPYQQFMNYAYSKSCGLMIHCLNNAGCNSSYVMTSMNGVVFSKNTAPESHGGLVANDTALVIVNSASHHSFISFDCGVNWQPIEGAPSKSPPLPLAINNAIFSYSDDHGHHDAIRQLADDGSWHASSVQFPEWSRCSIGRTRLAFFSCGPQCFFCAHSDASFTPVDVSFAYSADGRTWHNTSQPLVLEPTGINAVVCSQRGSCFVEQGGRIHAVTFPDNKWTPVGDLSLLVESSAKAAAASPSRVLFGGSYGAAAAVDIDSRAIVQRTSLQYPGAVVQRALAHGSSVYLDSGRGWYQWSMGQFTSATGALLNSSFEEVNCSSLPRDAHTPEDRVCYVGTTTLARKDGQGSAPAIVFSDHVTGSALSYSLEHVGAGWASDADVTAVASNSRFYVAGITSNGFDLEVTIDSTRNGQYTVCYSQPSDGAAIVIASSQFVLLMYSNRTVLSDVGCLRHEVAFVSPKLHKWHACGNDSCVVCSLDKTCVAIADGNTMPLREGTYFENGVFDFATGRYFAVDGTGAIFTSPCGFFWTLAAETTPGVQLLAASKIGPTTASLVAIHQYPEAQPIIAVQHVTLRPF